MPNTVLERRLLRFQSLDDVLREAEKLAAAESQGKLCYSGTWTLGQIFGHLATWIDYAFDGTPLKPPFIIKLMVKMMGKRKFIDQPMRAGVRIPKVEGGTLGIEPLSTAEGLARLRASIERLKREAPQSEQVFFGKLTHLEWIKLNLRHAELHLGYAHCSS